VNRESTFDFSAGVLVNTPKLVMILLAICTPILGFADDSTLSTTSAELVRQRRTIAEMESVIQKQQTQIAELAHQLSNLLSGQTRIANLRVGKISFDGGAIDTNGQNMSITHNNGASILLHLDRVWLRAPSGHTLHLQTDGNLVLDNPTPKTIWHTATYGR
jgi:hypothetical protein